MKECIKCRQELADDAVFCHACGAKQVQEPKKCFKCGHPIPDGGTFCSNCGTRQDSESSNQPKQTISPASVISNVMENPNVKKAADSASEISQKIIQYLRGLSLKDLSPELIAVAVCFLIATIMLLYEGLPHEFKKHLPAVAYPVFICTCISNVVAIIFILIKKEKWLFFPFLLILVSKLADDIALSKLWISLKYPDSWLFSFKIFPIVAYVLIAWISFNVYRNKTLPPKWTLLYTIAVSAIMFQIPTIPRRWILEPGFFIFAGFAIYLIYIFCQNNKMETKQQFSLPVIIIFIIGALCSTILSGGKILNHIGIIFYGIALIVYLFQSTKTPKTIEENMEESEKPEMNEDDDLEPLKTQKFSHDLILSAIFFLSIPVSLCFEYFQSTLETELIKNSDIFIGTVSLITVLSIPVLIFIKKEKWLIFPFSILFVMLTIKNVIIKYPKSLLTSDYTDMLSLDIYALSGYIVVLWESLNVFRNKASLPKFWKIYAVIAIFYQSIAVLCYFYTKSLATTLSLAFVMYLKWVSQRKEIAETTEAKIPDEQEAV